MVYLYIETIYYFLKCICIDLKCINNKLVNILGYYIYMVYIWYYNMVYIYIEITCCYCY